jgi:hypothetical protein
MVKRGLGCIMVVEMLKMDKVLGSISPTYTIKRSGGSM